MTIKSWIHRERSFIWIASLILVFGLLLGGVGWYVGELTR
jgi:uncharacterized membrane protein